MAVLPPIDWVPADVEIFDAQEKPQVWLEQAGARVKAAQRLIGHGFQNPCDGMRNARLKREDAFSHATIIVSSAMVSSS
jgi:hypothetical protein